MSGKPKDPMLTLSYENSRPIELADLTVSLQAVARRYSRFVAQSGGNLDDEAVKLYVRHIRDGSIVVDLTNTVIEHATAIAGFGAGAALLATQTNAIIAFAKHLRDGFNHLLGRAASPKPDGLPESELRDLARIVEPVVKDVSGKISITATDGASIQVSVNYNYLETNSIQNQATKEIEDRREPVQKRYSRVLMYWHQAGRDKGSRADRASIDSIWDRPLKVVFDDADFEMKNRMISGQDNPFTIGFLVDVELLTVRGKPAAYKVTHLYEVLDEPEPEEGDDPA
jgi:hypothetical protein